MTRLEAAISRSRSPYGLRAMDRGDLMVITLAGEPLYIVPPAEALWLYRKLVDEWLERQER